MLTQISPTEPAAFAVNVKNTIDINCTGKTANKINPINVINKKGLKLIIKYSFLLIYHFGAAAKA